MDAPGRYSAEITTCQAKNSIDSISKLLSDPVVKPWGGLKLTPMSLQQIGWHTDHNKNPLLPSMHHGYLAQ